MRKHTEKDPPPGEKSHAGFLKYFYTAALAATLIACNVQPVMAANVWEKASEIMKDVYNQIVRKEKAYRHYFRNIPRR